MSQKNTANMKVVEGSYAVAVLAASSPYIVCARKDSPLVLGKGETPVAAPVEPEKKARRAGAKHAATS